MKQHREDERTLGRWRDKKAQRQQQQEALQVCDHDELLKVRFAGLCNAGGTE